MKPVTTVAELRRALAERRLLGQRIGFVPTMGYLHAGHMSLVAASTAECQTSVVSIFVNPTQFGPAEDLAAYPRDLAGDLKRLAEAGVDFVFTPEVSEIYPEGFQTFVEPGSLAEPLCGAFRPGHFRGVATVVAKLFNMVQPDVAYFGRKDYQQLAIVRRMVRDLNLPVEVVGVETVREADGLALSSRNAYLDDGQRQRARCLSRGLLAARTAFSAGERSVEGLLALARAEMREADRLQYLELVDGETLARLSGRVERPAVLAVAAYFGKTRLIDNVALGAI